MVTSIIHEQCFPQGRLRHCRHMAIIGRNNVPQQFEMLIVMLRAIKPPSYIYAQHQ